MHKSLNRILHKPIANAVLSEVQALASSPRWAVVPAQLAGRRADQILVTLFPEYSRSRIAEWLKTGAIRIDDAIARPKDALEPGQRVLLTVPDRAVLADRAESIPLAILYQDADLLIVNKPVGLVVHPGAGNASGTLVNALLHFDSGLDRIPRAGIVHRLDKETSGCLLVARTLATHAALVAMLAARKIHRQYDAVVVGRPVAGGSIEAPIDRNRADRLRMAVVEGGRPAVTHYRIRERFRGHTRLQLKLETGRTHQIRVHMAHLRFPLLGDPLYGGGLKLPRGASEQLIAVLRGFKRQALHAERLAFEHPVRGGEVVAEAPLPPDLAALIDVLRRDAAATP